MKKGFTLIELLVVIAIIAILAILSLPKVLGLFETAKKKVFIIEAQSLLQAAELKVSKDTFFSSGSVTEFYLEDLQGQVKIKEGYYGKIVLENNVFKITLTDGKYFIDNLSKEEITPKALEEAVLLESQFQRNVGSGGTYTLKNSGASNEAKFFAGPNPNNWIQFGKDNNHYILMWRIIKANAEGIKIIYEGIRNGNNFPTADGRVTIDGTELIAWHTSNGNKWKTATLKSKLENWYNSLRIEDKLIQQIKWCLGGVGEGTGYSTTPVSISQFIAAECIDGTYGGGAFDGKTESVTGYGLIRASDYLSTTSSALCTGSYYASGNNNRDCGVTGGQSTNFLYKSSYKWWTFTANNTSSTIVWGITNTGVITTPAANDTTYSVRPVLNLKPDILYKGGFGTLTNPYIVE